MVHADISKPILRFSWKSIRSYGCQSYSVRWKQEHDVDWQIDQTSKRHYELNLEQKSLSFTDIYEIQIAANIGVEKTVQSRYSQSRRFILSELFGEYKRNQKKVIYLYGGR